MAMIHAVITGRITPPGSDVAPGRLKVTAKPETEDSALTFPGDRATWGPTPPVITDESGDLGAGLKIPLGSATPGVLWKFIVEPIDRNPSLPSKWVVGPFEITADKRFDQLVTVSTTAVTPEVIASVSGFAVEAAQARDEAVAFGGTNNAQVAGMVDAPGPTRDVLAATYGHTGYNLNRLDISDSADIAEVLNAAIAAGIDHVVIPRRATPWPLASLFTFAEDDRLTIEFERGARVSNNMGTEAAIDLANTTIRGGNFTSPFTGPTSAADWRNYALATPTTPGELFQSPARAVLLRDNCRIEDGYYHEYATTGLQVLGAHVKLMGDVTFHGMRHRTGWAEGIHIDGGLGGVYDFDCYGAVNITDSDRGVEVEEAAYDITFHGGGRMVNIFPNGYAGAPTQAMVDAGTAPDAGSKYANYTFTVPAAHSHSGGGGARNVRALGEWVLENCGSGPTFVRSSGSNDSDLPRDCYVEKVVIRGRGLAPGYLAADLEGYNTGIGELVVENSGTYAGGAGGTFVRIRFGNGRGNYIDVLRLEKFSLPAVTVDLGADSGSIGRIEVSDGKLNGTGYLIDVAGPRFKVGEVRARDVGGTAGILRAQATAVDWQVDSADWSVKSGETIELITDLTPGGGRFGRQKFPVLSAGNRTGKYVALGGHTVATNGGLGNNQLRLAPVYIGQRVTIDKIGGEVTVAGDAGCVLRLAIYSDAQGLPGEPLVDKTIPGDAVAVAEAALTAPVTLEAGWYWAGGAVQGAVTVQPTVRTGTMPQPGYPLIGSTGAAVINNAYSAMLRGTSVSGALPSYGASGQPTSSGAPRVFVRLV